MEKRPSMIALTFLSSVFAQISREDDGYHEQLQSTLGWIEELVKAHGMPILMIDFPEMCKVIDLALSSEQINFADIPKTLRGFREGRYQTMFDFFLEKLFDKEGRIVDDPDPSVVFYVRQCLLLYKKVMLPCPQDAVAQAVQEFLEIEKGLRKPSLAWNAEPGKWNARFSRHKSLSFSDYLRSDATDKQRLLISNLDLVCRILSSEFGTLDYRDIIPRHGPGSVSDLKGTRQVRDTGTNRQSYFRGKKRRGKRPRKRIDYFYPDKFRFPAWSRKLGWMFPSEYFTNHTADLDPASFQSIPERDGVAKLLAVPKTLKGPRLIAAEPTSNQFIQLGLMGWLRDNLPKPLVSCINFRTQEPSRRKCLEASVDGLSATVDLSSASDRLTCSVVERAFWSNKTILHALYSSRTRRIKNGVKGVPAFILNMRKFAAQGSGTTFPVQSIVYAMLCIAVRLTNRGVSPCPKARRHIQRAAKEVRIFGDDLIVPVHDVPDLVWLLDLLDLKVNESKTHSGGRFRESCGIDAYNGVDVTPLYLSHLILGDTSNDLVSWVDVANNAHQKGLWTLSSYMDGVIPKGKRQLIPASSESLGCLSRYTFCAGTDAETSYSPQYSGRTTKGLSPSSPRSVEKREDTADLTQYFLGKAMRKYSDPLEYLDPPKGVGIGVRKRVRNLLRVRRVGLTHLVRNV